MADQVSILLSESIVNAGSAVTATVNFRTRATAAASTPTSIRYRVDCLTTKRALVEWTAASAASTATIVIPGPSNAIVSDSNDVEVRQLTVEADQDLSTQVKAAATWRVRNIRHFPPFEFPIPGPHIDPYFAITAAELAAGITPTAYQYGAHPVLDFHRYGGVVGSGNGATNDAALTSAVAVLGTNGGVIQFGKGEYYFDSVKSFTGRTGIIFRGTSGVSGGLTPGTQFVYTGTTEPFIDISGALGVFFEDISFRFSNTSFTGALLKAGNDGVVGDAFRCGVRRCLFGHSIGTGCVHLDLDKAIEFVAEQCHFIYGNPSVKGKLAAGSSYSNVISFRDCTWTSARAIPVTLGGDSWTFDGCTFEQMLDGTAGAFDYGSESSHGMSFRGCWFGDVTANNGTWITYKGVGLVIQGNQFGGDSTSRAIRLDTVQGFCIEGNGFDTFSIALRFGDSNSFAGSFRYNSLVSVTTPVSLSGTGPGDVNFDYNPNYPLVSAASAVTHQLLTGAGAVDLTHKLTRLVTTGADALTLADGVPGQEKTILMQTDGGDGTLTPTNLANFTTITFNDVGDTVVLLFNSGDWNVISNSGCTLA